MIEAVTFKIDYRCFKAGERLTFHPGVNLLVGDQGCGKSSILGLLLASSNSKRTGNSEAEKTISIEMPTKMTMFFKDFEKENPRTQSQFVDNLPMTVQIAARWSSHGESSLFFLRPLAKQKGPILLLADEPDMALSPRSAYELARILQHVADEKGQVLAAVHNPILIESQPEVFSLEHRRWMPPDEFLELEKHGHDER